ncbi:Sensory box histidine kinase [Enhygromyxa salina]|uniref:histidine kinase n=1 Tax=Enhygromyxa salina TaxID=215803 RepID=A0A0C2CXF9_9BACT|nr:HAMP domain-containing sensor histidine kinase [Enhygromyxa salina]KIG15686.1 Sensory box histidine kinase [Enhygromyxa salina]
MKPRATWISAAASLLVVVAVMAWVSSKLLEFDADRARSHQQAVVEEQSRLALWRIDSAMTPILSREVAALDEPPHAELAAPPQGVVMRFELTREELSALTRVDAGALAQLERSLKSDDLFVRVEAAAPREGLASQNGQATPYALKSQSVRNEDEWTQRKASVEDNLIACGTLGQAGQPAPGAQPASGSTFEFWPDSATHAGPEPRREFTTVIEPMWVDDKLLLVSRASVAGSELIVGTWLDWPASRALLLGEIEDLLPGADLIPVPRASEAQTERLLATLPARLEPGASIVVPVVWSPLRASLLAAWLIVLAAFAALMLLVRASLRLSERRATFVSAVTHELRTPLTTFRMYTEMLGEGMVEHKRDRYVAILRREADRLAGLVENVLAYARIESEHPVAKPEAMSVGLLLDRVLDRLRERCAAAAMQLECEASERDRDIQLEVDPAAVEQILFNLVDNATKYAGASAEDSRVRLELEITPRSVGLHVRDFGPGVAADDLRRIFEPFTKAKADAAGTVPGVGLGLALSRRLARQMGGELTVTCEGRGADFVLTLPRA